MLDDFIAAKNDPDSIYVRSGAPRRLNLLLHGPPGTGKTSLVKAMALHYGYSIILVNPDMVRTNETLTELFEIKRLSWISVPYDKRIVLFEDVDRSCLAPLFMRDMEHDPSVIPDRNVMMNIWDGMLEHPDMITVCTMNASVDRLRPEVVRYGRMHAVVCIDKMSRACVAQNYECLFDEPLPAETMERMRDHEFTQADLGQIMLANQHDKPAIHALLTKGATAAAEATDEATIEASTDEAYGKSSSTSCSVSSVHTPVSHDVSAPRRMQKCAPWKP